MNAAVLKAFVAASCVHPSRMFPGKAVAFLSDSTLIAVVALNIRLRWK
jgi:hypothetical protein